VLAYQSGRFVASEWQAGTEAFLGVPTWSVELILPFAFGLIGVRYGLLCVRRLKELLTGEPA